MAQETGVPTLTEKQKQRLRELRAYLVNKEKKGNSFAQDLWVATKFVGLVLGVIATVIMAFVVMAAVAVGNGWLAALSLVAIVFMIAVIKRTVDRL